MHRSPCSLSFPAGEPGWHRHPCCTVPPWCHLLSFPTRWQDRHSWYRAAHLSQPPSGLPLSSTAFGFLKILNRMLPGTDREASPRNSVEDILNFYISLFLYLLITASYTQRTSLRISHRLRQPIRFPQHILRLHRMGRVPGCVHAAGFRGRG